MNGNSVVTKKLYEAEEYSNEDITSSKISRITIAGGFIVNALIIVYAIVSTLLS